MGRLLHGFLKVITHWHWSIETHRVLWQKEKGRRKAKLCFRRATGNWQFFSFFSRKRLLSFGCTSSFLPPRPVCWTIKLEPGYFIALPLGNSAAAVAAAGKWPATMARRQMGATTLVCTENTHYFWKPNRSQSYSLSVSLSVCLCVVSVGQFGGGQEEAPLAVTRSTT